MASVNDLLQFGFQKESCSENFAVLVKQTPYATEKQNTVVQKYPNLNCSNNQSEVTKVPNTSQNQVHINRLMFDLCGSFEKIGCDLDDTTCNICSFKAHNRRSLKIHYMILHGKHAHLSTSEQTTQEVICRNCEIKKQKIMSSMHYTTKYKNMDLRCYMCQYKTSNRFVIKAKKLADGTLKTRSSTIYRCRFCYYKTLDSLALETHYKRRHEQAYAAVQSINHSIPLQKDLQQMTEKCDKNTSMYKCYSCNYKTEMMTLFQMHILKHAEDKYLLNRSAEQMNEILGSFGQKIDIN